MGTNTYLIMRPSILSRRQTVRPIILMQGSRGFRDGAKGASIAALNQGLTYPLSETTGTLPNAPVSKQDHVIVRIDSH